MAGPARLVAAVEEAKPLDARGRRLITTRMCRRGEVLLREMPLLLWGPDARSSVEASGGEDWLEIGDALGDFDALAALLALRAASPVVQAAVKRLDGAYSAAALDMSSELAGVAAKSDAVSGLCDEIVPTYRTWKNWQLLSSELVGGEC